MAVSKEDKGGGSLPPESATMAPVAPRAGRAKEVRPRLAGGWSKGNAVFTIPFVEGTVGTNAVLKEYGAFFRCGSVQGVAHIGHDVVAGAE